LLGMVTMPEAKRMQWVESKPMNWAFMILRETFGSGVQIGTGTTVVAVRPIQRVDIPVWEHHWVRKCFAVAVGATMRTSVARRSGIGAVPQSGVTTSAFG
jgi:hypothetical protein